MKADKVRKSLNTLDQCLCYHVKVNEGFMDRASKGLENAHEELDELEKLASRVEELEIDSELSYHANVNLVNELEEVKGTRDYYIKKYKQLKEGN